MFSWALYSRPYLIELIIVWRVMAQWRDGVARCGTGVAPVWHGVVFEDKIDTVDRLNGL